MKKLCIALASVLGLSPMAMSQTSSPEQNAASVEMRTKGGERGDKGSRWSFGKKRHKRGHKRGLGFLLQSEPIRVALKEKAHAGGFDLETRKGKRGFVKSLKERTKEWAKAQGVDVKDRAARRAFRKKVADNQKTEAAGLGLNLDSLAGKEQYALHLISKDRLPELMMQIRGRRHHRKFDSDNR